jgi:hypothetical protein
MLRALIVGLLLFAQYRPSGSVAPTGGGGGGPVVYVDSCANEDITTGNSATCAISVTAHATQTLLVDIHNGDSGTGTVPCTDSTGDTLTLITLASGSYPVASGSLGRSWGYIIQPSTSATHTITCTWSLHVVQSFPVLQVHLYSGGISGVPAINTAVATQVTDDGADNINCATLTSSATTDLLVSFADADTGGVGFIPYSPLTNPPKTQPDGGNAGTYGTFGSTTVNAEWYGATTPYTAVCSVVDLK